MKDKWEELVTMLSRILSIYQALLTLSGQKNQVLIAAQSHELEKVVKQEEILIKEIGKLEALRGRIVSDIVSAYGKPPSQLPLEQLQEIAPPGVVKKLAAYHHELRDIMAAMAPLNQQNTELIQQALGFINYNINILSRTVAGPTYASKGQNEQQAAPQRKLFDARV